MNRRQSDSGAPFQTIDATARITGLSRDFIRRGVKAGKIPYIRGGSGNAPYLVHLPLFMKQLEAEAAASIRGEAAG